MAIFDYESEDEEPDQDGTSELTRVVDAGNPDYRSCRITIPKEVADEIDVEPGDHVMVEVTDNGFEGTIVDI